MATSKTPSKTPIKPKAKGQPAHLVKPARSPDQKRPRLDETNCKPTARMLRFVDEYLKDLHGTRAATAAGFSAKCAGSAAHKILKNPAIIELVEAGKARIAKEAQVDQTRIVRQLELESNASVNDLMQYRRNPCRHCYGKDHRYQFTPAEMELAQERHEYALLEMKAQGIIVPCAKMAFDEKGGLGYDPRKPPNPDCPECFGDGKGEVFVKDTRHLDERTASIYGGVSYGKDGLKAIAKDQNTARKLLMQHTGMLDRKLTVKGDPNHPIDVNLTTRVIIVPAKDPAKISTSQIKKTEPE